VFKCGTGFYHFTGDTLQMFTVKGQRLRSHRKVMYQQQKCYNIPQWIESATSIYWHGVVIKAANGWLAFAIATFASIAYFSLRMRDTSIFLLPV